MEARGVFAAAAFVLASLGGQARGTVQATGAMAAPRAEHTATFLGTGKVLVAGGTNAGGRLATAELYDPATGAFAAAASMPEARNGHTATLLPNGKVLVVGGSDSSGALATCRLYDPRTGAWASTGSMATARREHTATLLLNGKVLVAGGQNGSTLSPTALSSAELYDPATGTWAATGALGSARAGHAAALLEDGKVLVAGGQTKWFPLPALYTATAYVYDPGTGTWSVTGSMATARRSFTLTRIPGGLVVAAGGRNASGLSSAERYNVSNGAWGSAGDLGTARTGHAAALLPNARILLVGGRDETGAVGGSLEYNPATNTWTEVETGGARYDHSATLLPGGRVLAVGGVQTGWLSDTELVDRASPSWSSAGSIWGRKDGTATTLSNGKVLVLGTASAGDLTRGALFNPGTNAWAYTVGTMVVPRSKHVTVPLADGRVLILGGVDLAGNRTATCEIYDPATDSFTTTPSLPGTLRGSVHAVLLPDGRVLAAGNEWCNDAFGCNNPPYVRDPGTGAWSLAGSYPPLSEGSTVSLTLLPNGRVLSVRSEPFTRVSRASIFDPGAGDSWRPVCTLSGPGLVPDGILLPGGDVLFVQSDLEYVVFDARTEDFGQPFPAVGIPGSGLYATATALPDGRVLLVGGIDTTRTSAVPFAAVFDPATGLTSAIPDLAGARLKPATAVLPDGRVLVTGGKLNESDTAAEVVTSEVLDLWPGLAESWRPLVSSWPSSLTMPGAFTLGGTGFRGGAEASGGNGTQASPADTPSVLLRRAGGGPSRWVPSSGASSWSTTSFPSASVSGLPSGSYATTLWASGLPSISRSLSVAACELTTGVLESTAAASVCEGQPLSLSARAISGATYLWTLPDGSTSTSRTLSIPNAQVDDGGFYTVVATRNGCTSPPDTVRIRVASGLTAPVIDAPSTMGQGENGLASVEFHPGSTYAWTLSAGTIWWGQGSNEISFSAPATGTSLTITVVETVGASCVQPSAQKTIPLGTCGAPTPTPSNTGPYCEGATVQLSTPAVPGAESYSWEGPNGFSSLQQNPTIPAATSGDSGSYSVRVQVAGCWSPAASTAVAVSPVPPSPTAGSNSPVAAGATITLTASTAAGATYAWTGPNGFTSTQQNPTIPNAGAQHAGTYSVTATVSGCTSPAATTVVTVDLAGTLTIVRLGSGAGSVASSPAGISCGTACSAPFPASTNVTLTATADAGSRFAGWAGAGCLGTGSCTVTISGVKTVTATFLPTASNRFYSVTPCRVVDTRNPAGTLGGPALAAGATRSFPLGGACGVPSDAAAVSLNVTVADATAPGSLTLYPGTGPAPGTNTITFVPGKNRANNVTLGLIAGALSVLDHQASGTVNLIVDVNGYYR